MARLTELERLVVRLVGDTRGLKTSLREAEKAAQNSAQQFQQLGKTMSLAFTLPLGAIGTAATLAFAAFDKAIIESMALVEDATEHIQGLREQTVGLSKEMPHAATGLAEAYKYLILAGKSAEQSAALLPGVARFATAGAFDLKKAVDLATDVQTAMGLASRDAATDAKNMARVTDVLVKANTIANASTEQFSNSLFRAAPLLEVYDKSIEEGTAVLAAFASRGIKAQYAGGLLERGIRLLTKASLDARDEHERLGFAVFDSSGKMRNFADIVQNLEQIMAGMSDEQKAATLLTLGFEARMQNAILPLIGMSGAIRNYQTQLEDAAGATDKIQKFQLQAFSNQLDIVKNHVLAVAIDVGRLLAPALMALAKVVESLTKVWDAMPDLLKGTIVYLGVAVAAVGPLIFLIAGLSKAYMFLSGASAAAGVAIAQANVAAAASAYALAAGNTASIAAYRQLQAAQVAMTAAQQRAIFVTKLQRAVLLGLAAVGVAAVISLGMAIHDRLTRYLREAKEEAEKLDKRIKDLQDNFRQKALAKAMEVGAPTARLKELNTVLQETSNSMVQITEDVKKLRHVLEVLENTADPSEALKQRPSFARGQEIEDLREDLRQEFGDADKVREVIEATEERLLSMQRLVTDTKTEIRRTQAEIDKLPKPLTASEQILKNMEDAAAGLTEALREASEVTDPLEKALLALEEGRKEGVAWFLLEDLEEAIDGFIKAGHLSKLKDDVTSLEEELGELYKSQRLTAETFGMTTDEAELYRLELERARINSSAFLLGAKQLGDGLVNLARKQILHNQEVAKWVELIEDAKGLVEGLLTPIETYRQEVAKIQELREKGLLTEEFFNRAMKDAKDRLDEATDSARKLADEIGRVEAALAGGAEARSRVFEFRERLNEQRDRTPEKDGAGRQQDALDLQKDQNTLLQKQLEQLEQIRKGLGNRNPPANLGGP